MENNSNQNERGWQRLVPPGVPQNTQALTAMILSIFSLLSTFCCCLPAGLMLGILSVVLAVLSKKGQPFKGHAIAALIMGSLAVAANLAMFACMMLAYWLSESPIYGPMFNETIRQYQHFYESMPIK